MSKTGKITVAVIVIIVLAAGLLIMGNKNKSNDGSKTSSSSSSSSNDADVAATITYGSDGFSVSASSVKAGSKVKVVNNTDSELSFDSNPHPVHTDNSELNIGDIDAGASKTFVVNTKGSWGFHNHYNPSDTGSITVN